jgi:hypothetical protein
MLGGAWSVASILEQAVTEQAGIGETLELDQGEILRGLLSSGQLRPVEQKADLDWVAEGRDGKTRTGKALDLVFATDTTSAASGRLLLQPPQGLTQIPLRGLSLGAAARLQASLPNHQHVAGVLGVDDITAAVIDADLVEDVILGPVTLILPVGDKLEAERLMVRNARAVGLGLTGLEFGRCSVISRCIQSDRTASTKWAEVYTYQPPEKVKNLSPEEIVHSLSTLALYPRGPAGETGKVYRIQQMQGLSGPHPRSRTGFPQLPEGLPNGPDVLVLHDAGLGFGEGPLARACFPWLDDNKTVVVFKIGRHFPSDSDPFWEKVLDREGPTVVVVNADALRANGLNISRGLSWERTALDLMNALNTKLLGRLEKAGQVVVRLGLSGAFHCFRVNDERECRLYYDPRHIEGGYRDEKQHGRMIGINSALVATISARLARAALQARDEELTPTKLNEAAASGVLDGVNWARKLYEAGFGQRLADLERVDNRPYGAWHVPPVTERDRRDIQSVRVSEEEGCSQPRADWSILRGPRGQQPAGQDLLGEMACRIMLEGVTQTLREPRFPQFPVATFGRLMAVDRQETEAYRSVDKLIGEYTRKIGNARPLCLAVFGPPGAGKSFGVKEVAKAARAVRVEEVLCNLSQLTTPDDLADSFFRARDIALEGALPLVLFDEFDATVQGQPLGWLKYLLAPMQDGRFRHRQADLGLGKVVLVFAGATRSSHAEFVGTARSPHTAEAKAFIQAKGPDFASRLHGFVNVVGPNPVRGGPTQDEVFVIRRAVLFRSLLEGRFRHLLDEVTGRALIDAAVARAMIQVPLYKHGARSMEALLDTCALIKGRLEKASLLVEGQLDLHVDAEEFLRLLD